MAEIQLREVRQADLAILQSWQNNAVSLGTYDEPSFPSLERIQKKFESGDFRTTWIIEFEGHAIGYANFAVHPWDDWIACIGVIIAEPGLRGRGIGTEVHCLLAKAIFEQFPEIFKIEAFTDVENVAERRALEKAGFSLEGTQQRKNKLRGQFRDMHVFALLRP